MCAETQETVRAKLYGVEYGEFCHITWVTMTADGPEEECR